MTQRDSKDLADALNALAAGHHNEPEESDHIEHDAPSSEQPAQQPQPQATPTRPTPTQPKRPAPVPDARNPVAPIPKPAPKPVAPGQRSARPTAPNQAGSAPRPPVAAPPIRQRLGPPTLAPSDTFGPMIPAPPRSTPQSNAPKQPTARPSSPGRPTAPATDQSLPEPVEQIDEESSGIADAVAHVSAYESVEAETTADDNAVIAPAPSADVFKPHYRRAPIKRSKRDPLNARRTIIPILLTLGVLLPGIAVAVLIAGSGTFISDIMPHWAAFMLIGAGLLCLALAAINMMLVKTALSQSQTNA